VVTWPAGESGVGQHRGERVGEGMGMVLIADQAEWAPCLRNPAKSDAVSCPSLAQWTALWGSISRTNRGQTIKRPDRLFQPWTRIRALFNTRHGHFTWRIR
jgi:hypothetical protein